MELSKLISFYIIFVQHSVIWCRVYEECQGIDESEIAVASQKSCAKYVICDGESSYEGECLAGNYFNEKIATCDDPKNVKCEIVPDDDVKSIYDKGFVDNESVEKTTQSDKDNAGINDIKETDVEQDKNVANNTDTAVAVNNSKCPPLMGSHNIKNIANPESCVAFYTCYNGRAIAMLCPGKMYFNENSGKCESHMPESCKAKYSIRLTCYKGVYDFVPHPYRCEYYFYCLNGYLMIMRCPNDFTWHFERSTCVEKSKSKCYSENIVIYNNDYY